MKNNVFLFLSSSWPVVATSAKSAILQTFNNSLLKIRRGENMNDANGWINRNQS